MKNLFRKSCAALSLVLLAISASSQSYETALNSLSANHPVEKVAIHLDRDYYVAGETGWFRAYLYHDSKPSDLSNNFFFQLLDSKGKIILHYKFPVSGAMATGSFDIPDSIPQGYYVARAFSAFMMTDPSWLYYRKIFVFNNAIAKPATSPSPKPEGVQVEFFPESGELVQDIQMSVAFHVTDENGRPSGVTGVLKSDDGTQITTVSTGHDGFGKFQFRPVKGKVYSIVTESNGQSSVFQLPVAKTSGINLHLEDEKGGKAFLISRSKEDKEQFEMVHVVAQMNNRIVFESDVNFENFNSVKGHLLTSEMPSGILHFAVFNKEEKLIAERLCFVNNGEYQSPAIVSMLNKDFGPRKLNEVEISFPDMVQRSMSVSITDAALPPVSNRESIISRLMLTSDLPGVINNPDWYFRDRSDSTLLALDNLMMTQKWKRFEWPEIIAGQVQNDKIGDPFLIPVTGTLRDPKDNQAVQGGKLVLYLEPEDSVTQNFEATVNAKGEFSIDSLLFHGKTKFYYAYTDTKGKEKPVIIRLNGLAIDSLSQHVAFVNPGFRPANTFEDIAPDPSLLVRQKTKLEETKTLATVTVQSKSKLRPIEQVNEEYASGVFMAMGRSNFDLINEPENDRALSVYDFIRRSVKQVEIQDENFVNRRNMSLFAAMSNERDAQKQKAQDSINVRSGKNPGDVLYSERDPGKKYVVGIFLNESPTYIGILKTIRMDEIALVKFYEPGFVGAGGQDAPGGAISIYTRKGVKVKDEKLEKLDHVVYPGYSIAKPFYNPDYSKDDPRHQYSDNRATLYWNPAVFPAENEKSVRIRFFNNDKAKKFRLVVEGFDVKGRLIHVEKYIE